METSKTQPNLSLPSIAILAMSILISGYVFILAFRLLPVENTTLGLDWRTIWQAIQGGQIIYGNSSQLIGGFYTPPWGIWFVIPLGFLPFRESWGILSFITIGLLILSVPRLRENKLDISSILLLVLSFPALRNLADGNLEAFVIIGITLIILGYNARKPPVLALGVLLATIKFQETWLLCLLVLFLVWKGWAGKEQRRFFIILVGVMSLSLLLWGKGWLQSLLVTSAEASGLTSAMGRGSMIDITLAAALSRLGMPAWLIGTAWLALFFLTLGCLRFSFPKLALEWRYILLLVASSMLLAPYLSGNSVLTLVAIGIIPMWQKDRRAGLVFLLLINLPYLANREIMFWYSSYYWTVLLFTLWLFGCRKITRNKAVNTIETISLP